MNTQVEKRYARNITAISPEQLQALHSKKVCVVGGGGLGGYIVEILARIGILNITLIDNDVFDDNNLNRQLFSKESLLGKSKVAAAKERIAEVNSTVNLTTYNEMLTTDNAKSMLADHDLVMDALDNIQTRLMLMQTCKELGIPMVHGAIAGWHGQITSIFPGDDTLDLLYKNQDSEKGVEIELGNLPFTASTTASLQCAEAIKILTGKGSPIRNAVLQIDLLNNDYIKMKLR